jgi:hypothetical protein
MFLRDSYILKNYVTSFLLLTIFFSFIRTNIKKYTLYGKPIFIINYNNKNKCLTEANPFFLLLSLFLPIFIEVYHTYLCEPCKLITG